MLTNNQPPCLNFNKIMIKILHKDKWVYQQIHQVNNNLMPVKVNLFGLVMLKHGWVNRILQHNSIILRLSPVSNLLEINKKEILLAMALLNSQIIRQHEMYLTPWMARESLDMKIGFLNSTGHPMEVGWQESNLWVQQTTTSQFNNKGNKLNLNKLFLSHLLVLLPKEDTRFMLVT